MATAHGRQRALGAYLSLAAEDRHAFIEDTQKQTVRWTDLAGRERQATLPLVIYSR